MKEVAPGGDLHQWFDYDPEKWNEFRRYYEAELDDREKIAFEGKEPGGHAHARLCREGCPAQQRRRAEGLSHHLI